VSRGIIFGKLERMHHSIALSLSSLIRNYALINNIADNVADDAELFRRQDRLAVSM
jgi:hypothetical protein